ncbi:hypothetical protein HZS_4270 [Henneguya salminicola]|nr:hypothetical protein HZS_4270 [Henneguya salminicola]
MKIFIFSAGIGWFFLHDLYLYTGKNSEGREVHFLVGLFKVCYDTICQLYQDPSGLFKALQILCCFYIFFLIVLEIIIASISIPHFMFLLPAIILSFITGFAIMKSNLVINSLSLFWYISLTLTFTFLDSSVFYRNSVNFSWWNKLHILITLFNLAAALILFFIRREREKFFRINEPSSY